MKFVFIEKCKPVHSILKSEKESDSLKLGCLLFEFQFTHPYVHDPALPNEELGPQHKCIPYSPLTKSRGNKGKNKHPNGTLQCWAATVSVSKAQPTDHSQKKGKIQEGEKYH